MFNFQSITINKAIWTIPTKKLFDNSICFPFFSHCGTKRFWTTSPRKIAPLAHHGCGVSPCSWGSLASRNWQFGCLPQKNTYRNQKPHADSTLLQLMIMSQIFIWCSDIRYLFWNFIFLGCLKAWIQFAASLTDWTISNCTWDTEQLAVARFHWAATASFIHCHCAGEVDTKNG